MLGVEDRDMCRSSGLRCGRGFEEKENDGIHYKVKYANQHRFVAKQAPYANAFLLHPSRTDYKGKAYQT